MTAQAKALMQRPHVVIATPGRMRDHLTNDPDIAAVFARTKVVGLSVCLSTSLPLLSLSLSPNLSAIYCLLS
jgi:hypothetical protein